MRLEAQEEMQRLTEENQQLQRALKDKSQELQIKAAESEAELALKEKELQAKLALQQAEMTGKLQLQEREMQNQAALASFQAETGAALEGQKNDRNFALQADKIKGDRKLAAYKLDITSPDMEDDPVVLVQALEKLQESQTEAQRLVQEQSAVLAQLQHTLQQLVQIAGAPKTVAMPDGRQITIQPGGQPPAPGAPQQ